MGQTVRDPKFIKDLTARLRRIEGQARGIQRMVDEGRPCEDIVTQLSALGSAVERVAAHVILENLESCLFDETRGVEPRAAMEEAKRLLLRL